MASKKCKKCKRTGAIARADIPGSQVRCYTDGGKLKGVIIDPEGNYCADVSCPYNRRFCSGHAVPYQTSVD